MSPVGAHDPKVLQALFGKTRPQPSPDVPVVVDCVHRRERFRMTRCNYLTIDCEEAQPNWRLQLGDSASLSFLLLGLSGIVQHHITIETDGVATSVKYSHV